MMLIQGYRNAKAQTIRSPGESFNQFVMTLSMLLKPVRLSIQKSGSSSMMKSCNDEVMDSTVPADLVDALLYRRGSNDDHRLELSLSLLMLMLLLKLLLITMTEARRAVSLNILYILDVDDRGVEHILGRRDSACELVLWR